MYDLIIIGAGSAGITAADFAVQLGAKVAMVEKAKIGGDCTWKGCVPSKTLLHIAKQVQTARQSQTYGVQTNACCVDMVKVKDKINAVIQEIYQHETNDVYLDKGVDVIVGEAKFVGPHQIRVDDKTLESKAFLISTGASPFVPEIPGLRNTGFLTYEQIFENETLPDRFLILGAGPVGVEIGQAYARLGSKVTMIDGLAPLEKIDLQASRAIKNQLLAEGVTFVQGFATAVSQSKNGEFTIHINKQQFQGDMLLVATGRKPVVKGLDLDAAGVSHTQQGIQVNDKLQTSVPHIYAAGDCTGGFQATHYAGWQGFQAARNALLLGADKGVLRDIPVTVFSEPEVAQVGLSEQKAREKYGDKLIVSQRDLDRVDRAVTDSSINGFIKVLHLENGRILGATIVAERAGEMINEFALSIKNKLSIQDV
ncbi:MAG: FAD-dependent oxidoreductase, partial [Chloroflexota bacterium]